MPLDFEETVTSSAKQGEASNDDELDWCFEDPELTRSLRAIKSGRRATIASLVAAAAVLVTALVVLG
jgi:hypothetical protein